MDLGTFLDACRFECGEIQDAQTNNGDYEYVRYDIFDHVDYDRLMSWKAGSSVRSHAIAWIRCLKL